MAVMTETKDYAARNFESLLGLPGFSDVLLKNHFTLYNGYVTNTNKLAAALSQMAREGKTAEPAYAELKRRFGWEFGGMRLHEYYFENLSKTAAPLKADSALGKALSAQFGSIQDWEKDFRALGAVRGIGWVTLACDRLGGRLFNVWTNEHDGGNLPGCAPLLVMDVFEHAFMLDYGLKRADYIAAFFKAADWTQADARFTRAA
ncbi:MAG: Fe-Mn family superoxide dismutase [Elusimicrobiota bacterium]|jgi:Fe-Mn family superoxide dismutase